MRTNLSTILFRVEPEASGMKEILSNAQPNENVHQFDDQRCHFENQELRQLPYIKK